MVKTMTKPKSSREPIVQRGEMPSSDSELLTALTTVLLPSDCLSTGGPVSLAGQHVILAVSGRIPGPNAERGSVRTCNTSIALRARNVN
jgi:hypothetical protein